MKKLMGLLLLVVNNLLLAQTNYEEANVPAYTLPDALTTTDGDRVRTVSEWEQRRRPEILAHFAQYVYGKTLGGDIAGSEVVSVDTAALGGAATRKEVTLYLSADRSRSLHVLIYLPNDRKGPSPVFMGLNYGGNQAVIADPGIQITTRWTRFAKQPGYPGGHANQESRRTYASRWPMARMRSRGDVAVAVYHGELQV